MGSKQVCTCRVRVEEIRLELGVDEVQLDGFAVEPDWAGRPSLSVQQAAAFVQQWRAELAARQKHQDRLDALTREKERGRALDEALESALIHREARRRAAIRQGMIAARAAVHGGLVKENEEEEAAARGAIEAAARFDRANPLPEVME